MNIYKIYTVDEYGFQDARYCYDGIKKVMIKGRL